ncbi:hypothetical protein RvY_06498 [Ramazzottius varieornatus]|uniref:Uncharacterized protein n=1 Tax=Ramazzottius varieornatus TaxID=947166 RepID=A0A1D1UZ91_RAMVA|nr:hypothetical protein RvY_06498 [Ramazzottius varieornatus]
MRCVAGGALHCNTCNVGQSTCKNKADYHPEECSHETVYCMKADGVHEENNGKTGEITRSTGIWRACGDPEVAKVLFSEPDVKKHVHGCTVNTGVRTDIPIVHSLAVRTVSYRGTVCLCSGDNCNGSHSVTHPVSSILFLLLIIAFICI